jgi:hypothetical protein
MADCLCPPWAEASQREIKNGKSSLKTKGVEIKLFALSSSLVSAIGRFGRGSAKAVFDQAVRRLRKACEYKTYPDDGSILGNE